MAKTVTRRSAELNIEMEKGSTFTLLVTWNTKDQASNIDPVDLSGCTAVMQVRAKVTSDTILHELNTTDGTITLDAFGNINLLISNSDSTAFTWDRGVYSLEITFPNTHVRRLLRGSFRAFDETTR